ncbi:tRNA (guanine-N7)-methyltransferase [Burkholderia pseudomallei]|nr:tRNA (guanine-N7)-methyltransferase [Burkholderia pseudomallei]
MPRQRWLKNVELDVSMPNRSRVTSGSACTAN